MTAAMKTNRDNASEDQAPISPFMPPKEARAIALQCQQTLDRWAKRGIFPSPVRLSPGSVAYLRDEVYEWVESRKRMRSFPNNNHRSVS